MTSTKQTGGRVNRRSRLGAFVATLVAGSVAAAALAGAASAHQLPIYKYQSSFNGSTSIVGAMTSNLFGIAMDQSNGNLFVLDRHGSENTVTQFTSAGVPQNFSALGEDTIRIPGTLGTPDIIFDNSGYGGGLYVKIGTNPPIRAYNLDGTLRLGPFGGNGASCGIGISPTGFIWKGSGQFGYKFSPETGFEVGNTNFFEEDPCHIEPDSNGYYYLPKTGGFGGELNEPGLYKMGRESEFVTESFVSAPLVLKFNYVATQYSAVDPSDDHVFALESGNKVTEYTSEGQPLVNFGGAEGPFTGLATAKALVVNEGTHDVYVTTRGAEPRIAVFHQSETVTVPDVTTKPAGHPSQTSGLLKGTINADGVSTTLCKFEWGLTSQYTNGSIPCDQGNVFGGSSDNEITAPVSSLTLGKTYHYRLVSKNANERLTYGADRTFEASSAPTVGPVIVDRVNTDGARLTDEVNPDGGYTNYHFEIGEEDCNSNPCTSYPEVSAKLESNLATETVSTLISGLNPGTGYYVRLVAENGAGEFSSSYFFHTYPSPPTKDPCANVQVRKQTGAALLPDCRAYELVSAANAGGYDVESDLVPGQTPYPGYPGAPDRVLYGLHFGSIPDIAGSPPNYGVDPYVAERGADGWTTRYVGIPATAPSESAFGSPVLAASEELEAFAFGGAGICSPCFPNGATGIPVRMPDGSLDQGMQGQWDQGASTSPNGTIKKPLSADGTHLVFGSLLRFQPDGNNNTGDISIYDRNLATGQTQVVSKTTAGASLPCLQGAGECHGPGNPSGIAELDISSDGSHILIGQRVGTDAAGNDYFHLYMHVGTSSKTIDVTPGAIDGVLPDGMTSDGSKVFFTTDDELLGADTDSDADIYEAEIGEGGAVTLHLLTVESNGTPSNDESCTPPGNPNSWNSVSGNGECNAVAFAGGAGVASGDGTFYFVSPEQLEGGEGVPDQANLYVVKPGGSPRFVATIDSGLVKPGEPGPEHPNLKSNFTGSSLSTPEAVAVDQSNGDVYVAQTGSHAVARFKPDGTPDLFTEGPGTGTNAIPSAVSGETAETEIAVDNAPGSKFNGDFYVTHDPGTINVYSPTGLLLGSINGSGTNSGSFGYECGVAIDESSGALYVGDEGGEAIWRYLPTGSAPITDEDYTVTGLHTTGFNPCQVGADSAGHVYGAQWPNGPGKEFDASLFAAGPPPGASGTQITASARAFGTDPVTNEVYVNEGNQVTVFKANGEKVTTFGNGSLSNSRGMAVRGSNHHAFAPSVSSIVEFGYVVPPYAPIDNPAVVHGVKQAGTFSSADFQITPDGRYAAFASLMPLTGYFNLGHLEIYRYDSQEATTECASCATTGSPATADTTLSPHGLSLTDDGRVFFTSEEGLVLTDTNEKKDAYEWSGGIDLKRISTGKSLSDSILLTASHNGRDAFFFTRDVLVPTDENGATVKIYDAREGGGLLFTPSRLPCAASDECHGPGTESPPPPDINSVNGTQENQKLPPEKKACKRGFVKRHGKCVRKAKRHHKKHHRAARRAGTDG